MMEEKLLVDLAELDSSFFVEDPVEPSVEDATRMKALMSLVKSGGHNAVSRLQSILASNPDTPINLQGDYGYTVLMRACMGTSLEVVQSLLAFPQTNVNLQDTHQYTALFHAVAHASLTDPSIVEALLAHPDLNLNTASVHGVTALILAAKHGKVEMLDAILAHSDGVEVNKVDAGGFSALMHACQRESLELVEGLLTHPHLNIELETKSGVSALSIAKKSVNKEILQVLLEGVNPHTLGQRRERLRHKKEMGRVALLDPCQLTMAFNEERLVLQDSLAKLLEEKEASEAALASIRSTCEAEFQVRMEEAESSAHAKWTALAVERSNAHTVELTELHAQIHRLQRELDTARSSLPVIAADTRAACAAESEAALSSLRKELETAFARREEAYQGRIGELEVEKKGSLQAAEQVRLELQRASTTIAHLNEQVQHLNATVGTIKGDHIAALQAKEERIEALSGERAGLEAEVAGLRASEAAMKRARSVEEGERKALVLCKDMKVIARDAVTVSDDFLGTGACGRVAAGTLTIPVAVKTSFILTDEAVYHVRDNAAHLKANVETFENEAKVLMGLDHPHILHCHGISYTDETAHGILIPHGMVMERGRCSLSHMVDTREFEGRWGDVLLFLQHIASGLKYMHTLEPPVIHRDLKPANVLMVGGNLKLCDLGLAKRLERRRDHTSCGTPLYGAPELVSGDYGAAVDIFSFGVMAVELVLLSPPDFHSRGDRLNAACARLPAEWRDTLAPTMRACLSTAPEDRPTATEIVEVLHTLPSLP